MNAFYISFKLNLFCIQKSYGYFVSWFFNWLNIIVIVCGGIKRYMCRYQRRYFGSLLLASTMLDPEKDLRPSSMTAIVFICWSTLTLMILLLQKRYQAHGMVLLECSVTHSNLISFIFIHFNHFINNNTPELSPW